MSITINWDDLRKNGAKNVNDALKLRKTGLSDEEIQKKYDEQVNKDEEEMKEGD